jgi:hypothetical protein
MSDVIVRSAIAPAEFHEAMIGLHSAGDNHLGLRTLIQNLVSWLKSSVGSIQLSHDAVLATVRTIYDTLIKPSDGIPDSIDDMFVWPALKAIVDHFVPATPSA